MDLMNIYKKIIINPLMSCSEAIQLKIKKYIIHAVSYLTNISKNITILPLQLDVTA